ncbi:APC family permease [Pseudonocardia kujensis]|uniref:APC family permease n=1 Tax=Pseudonocardia kujensis TaxID=1128675 RepID=UPI001E4F5B12|nr:APC family permease [Pseudonocardia kujensis]MCE0763284.1 APC family permease [Pseudonocardia kujensis]
MPDPEVQKPREATDAGGVADLEAGHLSRTQIVLFAISSGSPAVGLSLVPMLMFSYSGLQSWPSQLLGMAATVCIGLTVSFFARRYVATGSIYSYMGAAFSGRWARIIVGAALLLGFILQVAIIVGVVGLFVGSFLTEIGFGKATGAFLQAVIYLIALGAAALIAIRGLDASVRTVVIAAAVSLPLPLLITVISGVHTGLALPLQFNLNELSISATFRGFAAGVAFLVGFESLAALAAETRDPKRNVPIAVMSMPVVLGSLYLLATIVQLPGLAAASTQIEAGLSPPAALALQAGLPPEVGPAADLLLAVSMFAGLVGFMNFGSRFVATLAADKLLLSRLAVIHHRYRSPAVAIIILAAIGFVLMELTVLVAGDVTTGYTAIATALVYSWLPAYLLLSIGAIVRMLRDRDLRWTYTASATLGALVIVWLYVNDIINPPPGPSAGVRWVTYGTIAGLLLVFGFVEYKRRRALRRVGSVKDAL